MEGGFKFDTPTNRFEKITPQFESIDDDVIMANSMSEIELSDPPSPLPSELMYGPILPSDIM
jgi:hypothetical protein